MLMNEKYHDKTANNNDPATLFPTMIYLLWYNNNVYYSPFGYNLSTPPPPKTKQFLDIYHQHRRKSLVLLLSVDIYKYKSNFLNE